MSRTCVISLALLVKCLSAADVVALRIVDPQSLGIPGAVVEVRDRTASSVRTDETGAVQVSVTLPAVIQVTAIGFEPETQELRNLPDGVLTIRLAPAIIRTTVQVTVSEPAPVETVAVGTAVEIDRGGARTVFDAVDQLVPGVFVTRRGVMGYGIADRGTGSVSIHGIGESPNTGVLIVVDGRPDVQGIMGHPLPDFYSLSNAESVSVTEGPASVLYGGNAMGGVIEIVPSRPKAGTETRLTTSLGSFLTGQHRLSHGTKFERGYYELNAGIDHTRGERDSAAYRSQDASLGIGYDLFHNWKASLDGRYGHFHVEDPGTVQAPLSNNYANVGRGGFSLNLDNAYNRTWGYMRFYSSHGRHVISDGFRSVDSTTGGRVLQSFSLNPELTLDAGSEIASYGGRATNVVSRLDYGEHRIGTAAGFSRLRWSVSERLRLNAGLRYEHNSVYGGITVPEFGASYRLGGGYSLGVAAARGFRSPTIRELYLFPAPNPLLKPETLWNYQATFRAAPSRSFQSSLTVYYADLSNMIVTTGRYPNLKLQNTGSALNRGVEVNARWKPVRRVQVSNSYAYLRSTNLSPYIPAHKWNASVDVDAGKAYVHLGATTVGKRWADTGRTGQLGGYTNATLKCTVPVKKHQSLFVMLDNLLDHRYEVVPGYPMPGINTAAGINLEF